MRLPLLLLFLFAGCYGNGIPVAELDVPLAGFSTFHVNASEQSLAIVFGDHDHVVQHVPCPALGANLGVRLNGDRVPLVIGGGHVGDQAGDDVSDNVCDAPLLQLDTPPPEGPALLEISDSATTVSCNLPDLEAVRQAMPVVPGTWEWRPGQAVTLQWSPSGDLRAWNSFSVGLTNLDTSGGGRIHDLTFDGDLLHFTVPQVAPGPYRVDLSPSEAVDCDPKPTRALLASKLARFVIEYPVAIVP